MERRRLTKKEVAEGLGKLKGWSLKSAKLHREYKFKDFKEAFAFMVAVAFIAESLDHHPDWANVYNRVIIELSTHDLGGISTLDFEFAKRVNKFHT
ncbi:MAG: 4a-hydroxytetrahydrobiopterin dehydratase [Bacteroidota bacterium]